MYSGTAGFFQSIDGGGYPMYLEQSGTTGATASNVLYLKRTYTGGTGAMCLIDDQTTTGGSTADLLKVKKNTVDKLTIDYTGRMGISVTASAKLHIAAGTATAGTSPFKFTTVAAVKLATPEAGVLEPEGNKLYYTDSSATRSEIATSVSTQTFTNKRITKRTGTTASSATPTINTNNVDFYSITAQTEAITSFTTNLSGTPTEGQTLWISITGTAARTITWGASFESSTVTLPSTTVTTARLDVGFIWNTVTNKWRCIAAG